MNDVTNRCGISFICPHQVDQILGVNLGFTEPTDPGEDEGHLRGWQFTSSPYQSDPESGQINCPGEKDRSQHAVKVSKESMNSPWC